jgi:peroxiredoxin
MPRIVVRMAVLGATLGLMAAAFASGPLVPGTSSPHFVAKTVDGVMLNLASTRGRVTLLSFFLTSYKDEPAHLQALERLGVKYAPRGFSVLSVALDQDRPDVVASYVRKLGVRHPVFLDPQRRVADKYGVQSVPTVYLLDPRGVVVRYQEGYMPGDEKTLASVIEALIDRTLGPGNHPDAGLCHCYAVPRP